MLAGVLPALRVTRVPLRDVLSAGGRTSARGGRQLAGAWLVSTEIALAVLLLTGASLLIRSFRSLLGRDIGFDTNVATAEVALTGPRYAGDSLRRYGYWDALIESYRSMPGVVGAAVTNWIPLGMTGQGFIDIADRDVAGAGAVYRTVSEDFFRTLSIPLVAGRVFDRSEDGPTSPRVVVVNRRMAALYWPGGIRSANSFARAAWSLGETGNRRRGSRSSASSATCGRTVSKPKRARRCTSCFDKLRRGRPA